MVKAILGYDIEPGISEAAYDRWLREIHIPDLKKIPGLKKIVLNTVRGKVREGQTFFRIAELHYESMESFEAAARWRAEHPVPPERGPEGRTAFRFYVICETEEVEVGN
ncbi:MAG: EthD family reductase [Deltaproteobacteria bacterium]|nr:EthD family reductase [Deltaproteobacteria bacterium]